MCSALLGFHALTGFDSTSSLVRAGKKTGWEVLNPFTAEGFPFDE